MKLWAAMAFAVILIIACGDSVPRAAPCEGAPDFDLWAFDLDRGDIHRLTNEPGSDGFADWSPDGDRIAFVASRDGNCEIYIMDPDGSNQVNLTKTEADELYPSWSPDGSRIVFSRDGADGTQLFALDIESGDVDQLTHSSLVHAYPDWSPDGSSIVFSGGVDPPGPGVVHQIYLVGADGGEETPVTEGSGLLVGPEWSPDGRRIAFFDHGDPFHVWVVDADGSHPSIVTEGGHLSWSPDGVSLVHDREVAPASGGAGADVDLYIDDELLVDSPGQDTLPSWSPDGEVIVFASDR